MLDVKLSKVSRKEYRICRKKLAIWKARCETKKKESEENQKKYKNRIRYSNRYLV